MKNRKGFTIVELVIVIAVIAILAAVLIPTFSGVVSKANQSGALQEATSAMKSTLAMSDYGTLAENTQFIIVNNDKIAYRFAYSGNQIKEIAKTENLPDGYNSIIVRGEEQGTGENKTYIANHEKVANLIGAALGEKVFVSQIATSANANGYYTFSFYVSATEGATHKLNAGSTGYEEATTGATHKLVELRIYINSDYPKDIVTVTKSN